MSKMFLSLVSSGSCNSVAGLGEIHALLKSRREILDMATQDAGRRGDSLESHAGISFVEDEDGNFHPERDMTEAEEFAAALEELTRDGKLFRVYDAAMQEAEFLADAADYGVRCRERAARLIA